VEHQTARVEAGPAEVAEAAPPAIATELRPGDALYMPRHTPHGAKTQETLSGHITVGVPATTWREVAQSVVTRHLRRP
jgi:quercetin dioxygenase-like cupin family protein